MADFKIHGFEEMELMLSKLARDAEPTARQALREAAAVVAERVRENIERLGEDRQAQPYPAQQYRYLPEGGRFGGVPPHQKEDLLEGLGITKVGVDNNGDYTVKVGFEGYGSQPTAAYPQGQPIPMIARSIESGSSPAGSRATRTVIPTESISPAVEIVAFCPAASPSNTSTAASATLLRICTCSSVKAVPATPQRYRIHMHDISQRQSALHTRLLRAQALHLRFSRPRYRRRKEHLTF